jgi:hypothetical protein
MGAMRRTGMEWPDLLPVWVYLPSPEPVVFPVLVKRRPVPGSNSMASVEDLDGQGQHGARAHTSA